MTGVISQKKRGKGKPFVKGAPGNPRGRPPLTEAQRLGREMRAQAQPELVTKLMGIINDPETERRDCIAAIKALLEELPKEVSVDVQGSDKPPPTVHDVLAGLAAELTKGKAK